MHEHMLPYAGWHMQKSQQLPQVAFNSFLTSLVTAMSLQFHIGKLYADVYCTKLPRGRTLS